jgi:hypothetical protein
MEDTTTAEDRSDNLPIICTWQQALLDPKSMAGMIEKRLIEHSPRLCRRPNVGGPNQEPLSAKQGTLPCWFDRSRVLGPYRLCVVPRVKVEVPGHS